MQPGIFCPLVSPRHVVSHHCIEYDQELAHSRCQCHLFVFTLLDEVPVKSTNDRIASCGTECRHVERCPDIGSTALNAPLTPGPPTITVNRRKARQGGDLLVIQLAQFWQFTQQGEDQGVTHAWHGG